MSKTIQIQREVPVHSYGQNGNAFGYETEEEEIKGVKDICFDTDWVTLTNDDDSVSWIPTERILLIKEIKE